MENIKRVSKLLNKQTNSLSERLHVQYEKNLVQKPKFYSGAKTNALSLEK